MLPYRKILQILFIALVIALIISIVRDAVQQYKYFTSQQFLIDEAHETLIPITVHTIHTRSLDNPVPVEDSSTDSLVIEVKKSMQNRTRQEGTVINASYNLSTPRKFIFKTKKPIADLFDLMLDNRVELEKLCVDGIHRLEGYITYGYGLNSLIQVAGIINGFFKLFGNIAPAQPYVLPASTKKYWFQFIVYLTRLLTMYQFIGNDKTIKDSSVLLINKIIPRLDQAMGWTLKGPEIVFIAIPKVLNSLYAKDRQFINDLKSQKFKSLEYLIENQAGDMAANDLMLFEGFYRNLYHTFSNYAATV